MHLRTTCGVSLAPCCFLQVEGIAAFTLTETPRIGTRVNIWSRKGLSPIRAQRCQAHPGSFIFHAFPTHDVTCPLHLASKIRSSFSYMLFFSSPFLILLPREPAGQKKRRRTGHPSGRSTAGPTVLPNTRPPIWASMRFLMGHGPGPGPLGPSII